MDANTEESVCVALSLSFSPDDSEMDGVRTMLETPLDLLRKRRFREGRCDGGVCADEAVPRCRH